MRCLLNQSDAKLIDQSRVGRPRFPALQTVDWFYPEYLNDLFELVHSFVLLLRVIFFIFYALSVRSCYIQWFLSREINERKADISIAMA